MKHQVRAKKHLGQHFLNDASIARQIVDALTDIDKTTPVIEVGPGTGVLTQFLMTDVSDFRAMDVDQESVDYLQAKYPAQRQRILLADFIESDLAAVAGKKFNVI